MNKEIKETTYDLWNMVNQYKALHEFYMSFKDMKNVEDIKDRIEYLKKNPQIKQRTELECLLWLLNGVDNK